MPWRRRGGAARTPRRCWASVIKRCFTRCGNLTWTRRERGGLRPQQRLQSKKQRRLEPFGTRKSQTRTPSPGEAGTVTRVGTGPIFPWRKTCDSGMVTRYELALRDVLNGEIVENRKLKKGARRITCLPREIREDGGNDGTAHRTTL